MLTRNATAATLIVAACLLPHALPHAAAQCVPQWEVLPGVNDGILKFEIFDDGTGPAIYAAGEFTLAGGQAATRIAKWDGTAWSPLAGPSGEGLSGSNSPLGASMAVFDDGRGPALYVGGRFDVAGGLPAAAIARWDGATWESLPVLDAGGSSPSVLALEVFDDGSGPALYAGGFFASAGGIPANNIARWDGIAWTPLTGPSGTGVSARVDALEVYDDGNGPALYVGGIFATAGGVSASRIARWDGFEFSPLIAPGGNGVGGSVDSLAAIEGPLDLPPSLYIGGQFATAGGVTVNRIARWDGFEFSPLTGPVGTGIAGNPSVRAIAAYDEGTGAGASVFIGGFLDIAGGTTVNRIARWNAQYFSPLLGPSGIGLNGNATAMIVFDDGDGPALYVGGFFTTVAGQPAARFARWKGCPIPTNCPGDITGDGLVNSDDLTILLGAFGGGCP
ncbi:MAG: hypothetical protein ACTS3F_00985 [Phycisphaerales bacterium]